MTGPIPVEVAREQLKELISILGELRNAGPRDQRFKQWRQITVTLLQRIWPGDPTRADRFRRIPFSAPTAKANPNATREAFENGCKEASLFLSGLAVELGCDIDPMADALSNYDDNEMPTMGEDDIVDLPSDEDDEAPVPADETTRPEMTPAHDEEPLRREEPPAPVMRATPAPRATKDAPPAPRVTTATPPAGDAQPDWSEVWKASSGPQPRLKDMLGFSDEAMSQLPQAPPDASDAPPPPAASPAPPPMATEASPPASPAKSPARSPSRVKFVPLEPSTPKPVAPAPASREPRVHERPVEPPQAPSEAATEEERQDLETRFVMESEVLQALARSTPELEEMLAMSTPTPAAQDVLSLAGQVEELGVPARERPIVRAALIDLARQMDSPPVHWGALRETVRFAMDHPELARRVLPLVLPYLDLAA